MSIEYCKKCDEYIDTDFNAEHFDEEECHQETYGELMANE